VKTRGGGGLDVQRGRENTGKKQENKEFTLWFGEEGFATERKAEPKPTRGKEIKNGAVQETKNVRR